MITSKLTTPLMAAAGALAVAVLPQCVRHGFATAEAPTYDAPTTASGSPLANKEPAPKCPMRLPNVRVSSYPTDTGAVIIFTTVGGQVSDLQKRGWAVAEVYDQSDSPGQVQNTPEAWPPPPAPTKVEVTDLPNGIYLKIDAVHPEDAGDVQEQILALAETMEKAGDCPHIVPRT